MLTPVDYDRASTSQEPLSQDSIVMIMIDSGAYAHVCPLTFGDWNHMDISERSTCPRCADGREIKQYGIRYVSYYVFGSALGTESLCTSRFNVCSLKRPILSVYQLGERVFESSLIKKGHFCPKDQTRCH